MESFCSENFFEIGIRAVNGAVKKPPEGGWEEEKLFPDPAVNGRANGESLLKEAERTA